MFFFQSPLSGTPSRPVRLSAEALSSAISQPSCSILIVRLSAHGDVIHTLPLLHAIREQNPNAKIAWLTEASAAPLLENHPGIDQLHIVQRKRWLHMAQNPFQWPIIIQEITAFLQALRQANYQFSFDTQGLLKSAIWPFMARIPNRLGYQATRENADRFYTVKLPPMNIRSGETLAIERYLDFARAIGCNPSKLRFTLPPASQVSQQKISALLGDADSNRPLIVLAPFTRWPSKHWIPEYWPQLIAILLREGPCRLAILGAPENQKQVMDLLAQIPSELDASLVFNLAGETAWPDLYVLFQRTRLLIGLDSAPVHIANAVGVPDIIALFGPTAPGRTGPIGKKHQILSTALACQPCFERKCPLKTNDCMKQLTPEVVAAMAYRMLAQPHSLSGQDS